MVLCILMLLSLNNPRSLLLFLMCFFLSFMFYCSTFILCAICGSGETVKIVVLVVYIVALVRPFSYRLN